MDTPEESGPKPSEPKPFGPQFHSKGLAGEAQIRRQFSEIQKKPGGLRDTDVHEASIRLKAILAGGVGVILGAALGFFLVAEHNFGIWIIPVCMLGFGLSITFMVLTIVYKTAAAGQVIYAPKATPRNKEYSYAESLVMRREFEDAIAAFEMAILEEDASDPTPYLRIARIYRDDLERYEDSVRWLNRALRDAAMPPRLVMLARKELVELYRTKLNQPQKAAPMLARVAEEAAGSPDGDWAARELEWVKEQMRAEEGP